MKVQSCDRCDNCRWACENHNNQPWLGARVCGCEGAGVPCSICNAADVATVPETPDGFQPDAVNNVSGKIDERGPQPKRPSLADNTAEFHVAESRRIFPLNRGAGHRVAKGHQALHTCLHFLATSSWFPATLRSERLSGNQTNGCNYRYRFHFLSWPTQGWACPRAVRLQ
jgi:hypothetical protein